MSLFVFQGCCNTYAQAANRRKRGKARYASSCSHRGAGSEEWHDMPRAAPQFKSVPLRKGSPVSTSFLFVIDTEWVMSIREHQGRDTLLQTGLKLHWSRRSASSCFNRPWRVTKSSAKHHSLLSPLVLQHQPWPSPWALGQSIRHGPRQGPYMRADSFFWSLLPSLSLSFLLSLSSSPSSSNDERVQTSCAPNPRFTAKTNFRTPKENLLFW